MKQQEHFKKLCCSICRVDLTAQRMAVMIKNKFYQEYIISTALNGADNKLNSFGTPLGKHTICAKIGNHASIYTIFKHRKNTHKIWMRDKDGLNNQDLILTRILRLKGEEVGFNSGSNLNKICVDSYERNIYIHGTNREDLLGTPASQGCIRMSNHEIIEFFSQIELGAEVYIGHKLLS